MPLIIVESPTKATTIKKFLKDETFEIVATRGHVRDLPKSKLGIDVDHDFTPHYIIPAKARKTVKALKEEIKKYPSVILATDEDREGEAIAWHTAQILDLKKGAYERIAFHEITPAAIAQALKNPHSINLDLVKAQQARRVLDRLVGYKLSPFLWKKIMRHLSAGRVQSVALRLIAQREKEIDDFHPQEYWTLEAVLENSSYPKKILAQLITIQKKKIPAPGITDKKQVTTIQNDLKKETFQVISIAKKEKHLQAPVPFRTSTLQQEAGRKLHFSSKYTMSLAQNLYEKGFISYHRTDATYLSNFALAQTKTYITKNFGSDYWQENKRTKTKVKGAQEAHEAIRPTSILKSPERLKAKLTAPAFRLYQLIWQRTVASQMKPIIISTTTINIQAGGYLLRANGQSLQFPGWAKAYPYDFKEKLLPKLTKGDLLKLLEINVGEHFTKPPARYTEPSLIKELEELGIGRPSTYAPILSTIQSRNYVEKNNGRFFLTKIGKMVDDILAKHFPKIVDPQFTATMEENLDRVAQGKIPWVTVIKDFYQPFMANLEKKYEEVKKLDLTEPTKEKCPLCGAPLIKRTGRFGDFYACSNFPKCKYTASLPSQRTGVKCPQCHEGEIIEKRNRRGQIFYACSNYPKCKFTLSGKPTGEKCPLCGSLLIEDKKGKIRCSNKECKYRKD